MPAPNDDSADLRRELEAIPRAKRLAYIADLPEERQTQFKRILPHPDRLKLNREIDRRARERRKPTLESWLAEARAGNAQTPEAMVEVLREEAHRLQPKDADWVRRINETASAGGFSKRQREVIGAIYTRYFTDRGAG